MSTSHTFTVVVRETTYRYATVPVTVELEEGESVDFDALFEEAEDTAAADYIDWSEGSGEVEAFLISDDDKVVAERT